MPDLSQYTDGQLLAMAGAPESDQTLKFIGTTGRSLTNNNPLNLEFRPGTYQDKYGAELEPVSESGKQRFAKFPNMYAGYQAGLDQIKLDQSRKGMTLAKFVEKFAPRHENPTDELIAQYSKAVGVSPDTPLAKIDPEKLIIPMMQRESSTRIAGSKGLLEKASDLLGPASAHAGESPLQSMTNDELMRIAGVEKPSEETAAAPETDLSKIPTAELMKIAGVQPSKEGEAKIGAKLGMVDIATTAARAVDPASAMTGAGIFPAADDPVWNAPQAGAARALVANKVMTQALFPNGVPPEKTGYVDWLTRDLARMWPQMVGLISLSGYAAPAELLGSGVAGTAAKGAVPFALMGLTEESPAGGAVKGAALGGALGVMHSLTGNIPGLISKWVSRIGGGAAIGGGSAYLSGGSQEEVKKNAVLFSLFEIMGMPRKERAAAAEKVPEAVKDELVKFAEKAEEAIEGFEEKSFPSTVTPGVIEETVGKGKRAKTVEKSSPGIEQFPEEEKLTPAKMELVTSAAGRERQLEIDKAPMQWQRERMRWLSEDTSPEVQKEVVDAPAAPETSEVTQARELVGKDLGVDPSKLEYKGVWEFGEGLPDHYMFNVVDPEHPQYKSTAIWPVELQKMYGGGPDTAELFRKYAPIWYSKMQNFISDKLPATGTGQGLASTIRSWGEKGQFKADELKWSGLLPWLEERKGKVTKQEVLDFLKENQVEVREVEKGKFSLEDKRKQEALQYRRSTGERLTPEEEELLRTSVSSTKFSQHQLHGGENYRELLLTLPAAGTEGTKGFIKFEGSHWDEPNVLAHVRMNDRTGPNGEKILFLEEVQSDWHQKGKREGYKPELPKKPTEFRIVPDPASGPEYFKVLDEHNYTWMSHATLDIAEEGLARMQANPPVPELAHIQGVPSAPFSKTWHELAMKRMLRYAAENGYDKVGWTTGEQQADRYDLSKHLDTLQWHKNSKSEYVLYGGKDGVSVLEYPTKGYIPADKLPDVVGKEIADKIVKSEGVSGTLSGLDLKVGGEGMKSFYDKIIPSFLNKYGKQWGAKVEEAEINKPYYVIEEHKGDFLVSEVVDGQSKGMVAEFDAKSSAEDLVDTLTKKVSGDKVHSLDITPSMKESILYEGQYMYSGGPDTAKWFRDTWEAIRSGRPAKTGDNTFVKLLDETKRIWAAETRGPAAMATAQDWVRFITEAKAEILKTRHVFDEYIKKFADMGTDEAYKLSAKMERGEQVPKEWQAYAQARKEAFDKTHNVITKDMSKLIGYIDNYAAHLYKNPEKAKDILYNVIGKRPLEGTKGFMKTRLIPDMDEARARGLEPMYDNPAVQDMAGLMEQWRYIASNKFLDYLEKDGRFIPLKDNKPTKKVPDGWVRTDPRVFRQGWLPLEARDLIYNHLVNTGNNLWYSKYRGLTAAWNAWHVAFSGFHAVATTVHEISMGFGQNIPDFIGAVLSGDHAAAATALKGIGPIRAIKAFKTGIEGHDAFFNPGKYGPKVDNLVDLATKGGLLPEHAMAFQDTAAQTLGQFLGQVKEGQMGRAFQSMMHAVGKPIMGYFVPRMKYGSTLLRLDREMSKLTNQYNKKYGENWSPEVEANYQKDLMDITYNERQYSENIFGEMDPDNLHWSRGLKKGLNALIAYPGWNVGTFRWLAGMVRGVAKTVTGKEVDYQARRSMQFGLGLLVTTGLINTILHMALNDGQAPDDWKDVMIGARTGRYLSNGAPERVTVASYMKDWLGVTKHPIKSVESKLMFPIRMYQELASNTDYFGTEIISSKGGLGEKAAGLGKYLAGAALPFGASGVAKGKSPLAQYGGFFGARMVPREFANTEAQNKIDELLHAESPRQRKQEASEAGKAMADLRELGWSGRRSEMEQGINEARKAGQLTEIQAKHIRQDVGQDKRLVQFKRLRKFEDALEVYNLGVPEERRVWRMALVNKWTKASPEIRRRLRQEYQEALKAPVAEEMPVKITQQKAKGEDDEQKRFSILGQ